VRKNNYFGTLFIRPNVSLAVWNISILISMITLVGIVSKWKANPIKIVGKEILRCYVKESWNIHYTLMVTTFSCIDKWMLFFGKTVFMKGNLFSRYVMF
jgi:hypothetical protein